MRSLIICIVILILTNAVVTASEQQSYGSSGALAEIRSALAAGNYDEAASYVANRRASKKSLLINSR